MKILIKRVNLKQKIFLKMQEKKTIKDINSKREVLDKQIDEEIHKAEKEISEVLKKMHLKKLIRLELKLLQRY